MAVPSTASSSTTSSHHGPEPQVSQVETLNEALTLLSEFASLDSSTYQSSLTSPTRTWQTDNRGRLDSSDDEGSISESQDQKYQRAVRRLEQIQSQKEIQETPLPALWRSLHRLHSNLAILQENDAKNALEIKKLSEEAKRCKNQNIKLQKAVKVLDRKNKNLKTKLDEKRSMLKQTKSIFFKQRHLEQENAVYKMQAHEQFLQQSSRERLESTDSNFSDADALFFAPQQGQSNESLLGLPNELSDGELSDTVSLHSTQSVSSFITDDGVSVVKLAVPEEMVLPATHVPYNGNASLMSDMSETSEVASCHVAGGPLNHPASPSRPGVYTLAFPYGQKHGLVIVAVPLKELPVRPTGKLTIEFLKDEVHEETEKETPSKTGFRIQNFLGKNPLHLHTTIPEEAELKGNAFVVASCEDGIERKPTVGARIVSVGGRAVDPSWKLKDLLSRLDVASGVEEKSQEGEHAEDTKQSLEQDDDGESRPEEIVADIDDASAVSSIDEKKKSDRTFSISFRNEALSKKQRDVLVKKGVDTKDDGNVSEVPKEHRAFGLGFLRIGNSAPHDKAVVPEETTHSKENDPNGLLDKESSAKEDLSQPKSSKKKGKNPLFFWERDAESKQSDQPDGANAVVDDASKTPAPKFKNADVEESRDETTEVKEEKPRNETVVEDQVATESNAPVDETGKGDEDSSQKSSSERQSEKDNTDCAKPPSGKGKNPLFFWDRSSTSEEKPPQDSENAVSTEDQASKGNNIEKPQGNQDTADTDRKSGTNNTAEAETKARPSTKNEKGAFGPFWRTSPRAEKSVVSTNKQIDNGIDPLL